jgi:ribulose-bisphosphate carboxylase small chain
MPARFETFAYLPPLSEQQILAQIEHLLAQGCLPQIEFMENPSSADFYWEIWPLPATRVDATSGRAKMTAAQISSQIEACARRNPFAYVAVAGYSPRTRSTVLRFVVKAPQEGQ